MRLRAAQVMTRAPLSFAGAAIAIVLCASAAAAEPAEVANEARADQLFKDAEQKFDSGNTEQACAAFAESLRLSPKLGTLLNLALCNEKLGKVATAWTEYHRGAAWAAQNGQKDRQEFAHQHAIALEPRLPRLILQLPPEGDVSTVEIDGEPLPEPEWFLPLYLDPGDHSVAMSAPGKRRHTVSIRVAPGPSAEKLLISPLKDEFVVSSADGHVQPVTKQQDQGTKRAIGFVVGGLGVVGVGVGTFFGVRAITARSDIDQHCTGSACDAEGVHLHDDALTDATVSTIAFGAGIVAAGVGTWLVLTSGPLAPTKPVRTGVRPMVGPFRLGLEGAF